MLEFLVHAVPDHELSAPWLRRAVKATAQHVVSAKDGYLKCGPLYHSVAAIRHYLKRVKKNKVAQDRWEPKPVVAKIAPELREEFEDDLFWVDPYPELGVVDNRQAQQMDRLFLKIASHPPAQKEADLSASQQLALRKLYRLFDDGDPPNTRRIEWFDSLNYWATARETAQSLLTPEQVTRLNQLVTQHCMYHVPQVSRVGQLSFTFRRRDSYAKMAGRNDPDMPVEIRYMKADKMLWDVVRTRLSGEQIEAFKKARGAKVEAH